MIVVNLIEDIVMRQIGDTKKAMSGEKRKDLERKASAERAKLRRKKNEDKSRAQPLVDESTQRGKSLSARERRAKELYFEATVNKPERLRAQSTMKPSQIG